jgi:TctA family transporter
MMDMLANLALGFQTAMSLSNLLYCLIGVFLGTAVGVLPGIGPIATIAMLLPITFGLPPVSALIMLSGIYYGAQYGGSTTAILINLPGESASVVTALDGYQIGRPGSSGPSPRDRAIGCSSPAGRDGAGGACSRRRSPVGSAAFRPGGILSR